MVLVEGIKELAERYEPRWKTAGFSGLRGWLYVDGTFETLESYDTSYHQEFAQKRIAEDSGLLEYMRQNPPDDIAPSAAQLSLVLKQAVEDGTHADWVKEAIAASGATSEQVEALTAWDQQSAFYKMYDAIRIWGVARIFLAETDKWTDDKLRVTSKFAMEHAQENDWRRFTLEDRNGEVHGDIFEIPSNTRELQKLRHGVGYGFGTLEAHSITKEGFGGVRGFLDENGQFVPLSSRDTWGHEQFAAKAYLEDSGIKDWIQANMPPGEEAPMFGDIDSLEVLAEVLRRAKEESEVAQWLEDLRTETGLDAGTLDKLLDNEFLKDWLDRTGWTRVWITGGEVLAERPLWKPQHLQWLWDWASQYIESGEAQKYVIGDMRGNNSSGDIWDMPKRPEGLFSRRRVAHEQLMRLIDAFFRVAVR